MSVTPDEVLVLLQVAQSYDNRNIDRLMQSAWLDAAQRAHWNRDDALIAVRAHYAESTERIMPGHVTARIRARKPLGFAPQYRPALAAAPPATGEQRAAAIRMFASGKRTQESRNRPRKRRWRPLPPAPAWEGSADPLRVLSGDLGDVLGSLREGGRSEPLGSDRDS